MRSSIEKADWSDKREQDYEHRARDIAFRAGGSLDIRGDSVYFLVAGSEQCICTPSQPSRDWCETWLTLHHRFPDLSRV